VHPLQCGCLSCVSWLTVLCTDISSHALLLLLVLLLRGNMLGCRPSSMASCWLAVVLCSCIRWVSRHQLRRPGKLQQQRVANACWFMDCGNSSTATTGPRVRGRHRTSEQRHSRSNSQSLLLLLLQYCPACWRCTAGFK
jgi:hypothetical protein